MSKPGYEALEIPLTKQSRMRRVFIALGCLVPCAWLFFAGYRSDPAEPAMVFWGVVLAALCAYYGTKAATAKTEWQLTENGHKQKAASRAQAAKTREAFIRVALYAAVAIIGFYWLSVPVFDALSNQVTVYVEDCERIGQADSCVHPKVKSMTFTVHVDQQFIILSSDAMDAPMKFDKCVIKDRTNWQCDGGSFLADFAPTMKDGEYSIGKPGPLHRFIPRYQWILDRTVGQW